MESKHHIQKAYESILGHDFEQAIEWFEQAVAEEPSNASYHYSLSITFARSNKLNKAIEHAVEACRLEPHSDNFKLHLSRLRAKQLLQKAGQLLHKNQRRTDEAMMLLQCAVRLDPLSVEALLILAIAYADQQRYREALVVLKEAARLEPQHKEVNELLEEYRMMLNK